MKKRKNKLKPVVRGFLLQIREQNLRQLQKLKTAKIPDEEDPDDDPPQEWEDEFRETDQ